MANENRVVHFRRLTAARRPRVFESALANQRLAREAAKMCGCVGGGGGMGVKSCNM